jgi:hypothetical protein
MEQRREACESMQSATHSLCTCALIGRLTLSNRIRYVPMQGEQALVDFRAALIGA